jgi:16S rRNA (adenine1518-N6/adenine1519-N6)-dimethyltransferase
MLVDDNDNPIGSATLQAIHNKGLLHRAVIINVVDEKGRILLQKRASWVATNPRKWDASAAGHVDEGESYLVAGKRELKEELGLLNYDLVQVDKIRSTINYKGIKLDRFITIYKVVVPANLQINYDEHEVMDIKWFTKDDIKDLIAHETSSLVPEQIDILEKYYL